MKKKERENNRWEVFSCLFLMLLLFVKACLSGYMCVCFFVSLCLCAFEVEIACICFCLLVVMCACICQCVGDPY